MWTLYYARKPLTDQRQAAIWAQLPKWKVLELLCKRHAYERELSLRGYALLAHALKRAGYVIPLHSLLRAAYGKPYFENGPEFSLSHCKSLAVCALSDTAVGVDVERLDAFTNVYEAETWTAGESYGKLRGFGYIPLPDGVVPTWSDQLLETYQVALWSVEMKWNSITEWDGNV